MPRVPSNALEMESLKAAVETNPVYLNALVSADAKTTSVLVEFEDDAHGYRGIMHKIEPIVQRERDASMDINIGGVPNLLARIEAYSERLAFLLPLAIVVLSLVLFEA